MSAEKELLSRVVPLAEEYAMFPRGGTVLCAVSGGVDSISLLHFLAGLAPRYGFALAACHLNHGIRPEAAADAAFVSTQCEGLSVPLSIKWEDVPAYAARHGLGLEEAGREVRYRFFDEAAAEIGGTVVVATAHNADDNAETLLLHLIRGCGLKGLGGIPPRRGRLVRPFLTAPRALIEAYAGERGLAHVEDATNADPAYTRNFLRLKVMPLLKELNPGLTDTLSATAAGLRRDGEFLTARAAAVAMDCKTAAGSVILPLACVNTQPAAVASRVAQLAVERLDPDVVLTAAQRRGVLDLCAGENPSGHLDLPHGISAQRVYDDLVFSFPGRVEVLEPMMLDFVGTRENGPWQITVERADCPEALPNSGNEFFLSAESPVLLRPRKTGDTLRLPHRAGAKSVKKWMIEAKIPQARRSLIPVLEQSGAVAAVYGLGRDADAEPGPGEPCLHISIKEKERTGNE